MGEWNIANKNDLKKIALENELIEMFKNVCETIITRRDAAAN